MIMFTKKKKKISFIAYDTYTAHILPLFKSTKAQQP